MWSEISWHAAHKSNSPSTAMALWLNAFHGVRFAVKHRVTAHLVGTFLAIVCLLAALISQTVPGQSAPHYLIIQNNIEPLQPGVVLERAIARDETRVFAIQLGANHFVRIFLDHRGSVLKTKVTAPDGTTLLEGITPNALTDVARFSFISSEPGNYRIEISHVRKETPAKLFSIHIDEERDVKGADRDITTADRLTMEAGSLLAAMSANNLKAAGEKYRSALELWRKVDKQYEIAQTLLTLGSIAHNLSQPTSALNYYQQSLPLWRALKDRKKEAQTLSAIGWTYFGSGDLKNASEYYNLALPIRQELNDLPGQAQTLTTLGQVYNALGEPQLAIEDFTKGLAFARQVGDKIQQAFALNNFSYMYADLGEYQKGLDCVAEALPLWKETGNRYGEADAFNISGIIYDRLGDFDQALAFYNEALRAWRFLGNRGGEADALNNIGIATMNRQMSNGELGSLQSTLDYLNQALQIRRSIGQHLGEDSTLLSLGVAYQYQGNAAKAAEYFKEVLAQDPHHPLALYNMGFNYFEASDFPQAIEFLNKALLGFKERGNTEGEAQALRLLAAAQEGTGDLLEARENAQRALQIIESSHARVVNPETRMLRRGRTAPYPAVLIDILSDLHKLHPKDGYDAEAFEASERARARGLLDTLAGAKVDLTKDVEPTKLAREHQLELQLSAKEQYRVRLLKTKGSELQVAAVENEISALAAQYRDSRADLLQGNPNYASLIEPKTLTVKETQGLLDNDTLLLEYRLAEKASFLWALTPGSFSMHVLPHDEIIRESAREVYSLMTARNLHPPGESPAQKAARVARADAELAQATAKLSEILLKPVVSLLGKKRLVIVGEGPLQYIPFGALPVPNTGTSKARRGAEPLMINHEIVELPSASVLEVLRKDAAKQPAPKTVAVFADPVYSTDDPRFKATPGDSTVVLKKDRSSTNHPTDNADDSGPQIRYTRLRFSRDEAKNIIALAPAASSFEALDFAASKRAVLTSDLAQYRILHFATHGILDSTQPELSGLALSLFTQDGKSLDGYLRLPDIYGLKLNADLVVLSGCQTALGKDLRAEGLIGLTRGFMYAGVPRVIASLWNVDDMATSALMKRFYHGVLVEGLRPAEALRAAQKSLHNERGWSSPYYWAAFTLQGEWK